MSETTFIDKSRAEGSEHASFEPISCELCGRMFNPKRRSQRFCSPIHRIKYFSMCRQIGVAVFESLKGDKVLLEFLIKEKTKAG